MIDRSQLKEGDKVHYVSSYGPVENGIVKEILWGRSSFVRVVYKCAGDWKNYRNYTSALTNVSDLKLGWSDSARNV